MTQRTPASKQSSTAKQSAARKAISKRAETSIQEEEGTFEEERQRMIAEEAYLIAERRGFQGDMAMDDWLQAEADIDARFASKH